jgi:hypothetical protein
VVRPRVADAPDAAVNFVISFVTEKGGAELIFRPSKSSPMVVLSHLAATTYSNHDAKKQVESHRVKHKC